FVQRAFVEAYQLALPRTTKQQSTQGVELSWTDAKQGDLVFFKTRRSTYHVGIYLGNKQFMHASTSKGVIISRIDNPYWASKFWQVRRVTL
ncbi:NlpC/P60 family protein, partial [Escherichia coli]|nr:NlpC/P60 family protein [Escherichia coli]